jgi:hypothetical protein
MTKSWRSWEIHDAREEVEAANTSWTIGSNEARAVPTPDLVDGGNTKWVINRSAPTPAAAVSFNTTHLKKYGPH